MIFTARLARIPSLFHSVQEILLVINQDSNNVYTHSVNGERWLIKANRRVIERLIKMRFFVDVMVLDDEQFDNLCD